MEIYKYLALWIFYNSIYRCSAINIRCENSNSCFCERHLYDTEFQCPNENSWKINIQVGNEHKTVEIQCRNKTNWYSEELPVLEIEDIEYFKFHSCPFPTKFAEIMDRLQINNTKRLQFYNSIDSENLTLTADYFKDVYNLEILTLNYVNLQNITDDAFQSLNKLKHLDLEDNKILLTDTIFKNLKKLKLLSLANNELSDLPSKVFENLNDLSHLSLNHNNITTISNNMFKNLHNLKLLQLRNMKLEHLPEDIFQHLENLKQVDLSINNLENIPKDLFKNNKLLEVVMLLRNPNITSLPNYLFSNLTQLKKILLSECNLHNLPNELFEGSINLERIDLQRNQIKHIPKNIFKGLEKLQDLDLSYNKIIDLSNEVFFSLYDLNYLNLQNNLLINIKLEHFYNLRSLKTLNLKNNKITAIAADSFQRVNKLEEIILAHNYLNCTKELFINNGDLRKIDLSGNNIAVMDNFTTLTKLRKLDISYNQISSLNFKKIFTKASSIYINLEHNNIKTINFTEADVVARSQGNRDVLLNENPLQCNCHLYNFVKYLERRIDVPVNIEVDSLTCLLPNNFQNISVTSLKPHMLTCSLQELGIEDKFTEKCSYSFRPWDKSLIVHCTNSNLTEAPVLLLPKHEFYNQTEMHLEGNLLVAGPKENTGYENVTKLYLSSNNINEITWIPLKLKVLKLENNNLSYLNHELLNQSLLTNITLGNNPWKCDCSTVNLISFLVTKLSRKQIEADIDTITCRGSGKLLVYLSPNDICPNNMTLILVLGIIFIFIVLFVFLLAAFYYRYQEEVKVWLFAHKMFLWLLTESEVDKDKIYDAFISYSHKDEDFVLNELLPVLEQSPQPYKFCLQIRDWVAGELISKQITKSVTESRRTIVILSHNFLDSEWGKMEFRTAHKQAISEGARVILILYGNIDIESDLDDELKAYVRTNTYIKWGDPWFWNRLKYALPHSYVKVNTKSQKTQNVTIALSDKLHKVNDKLDLINCTPSSPDPGTTPPINNLLIKNNSLKFTYPDVHAIT